MPLILACDLTPLRGRRRVPPGARRLSGAEVTSRAECAPFHEGRMHRVLILGAGKIGALIAGLLAESGSYRVQLADVDGSAADAVVRAHASSRLTGLALDATDAAALRKQLAQHPV